MGERTRYDPGTLCWVGLATSDVAAAKGFYTRLFGWQERSRTPTRRGAGGAARRWSGRTGALRRPGCRVQLRVRQRGCATSRAAGRTRAPGDDRKSPGRYAVIADLQNAAFAVFEGETDP
jgi:uncharacterized protein